MGQGWFLFGQIGAGKSSLGAAAAAAFGLPFHEGDQDLPPSVIAAIRERRRFTDELRDEFAAVLADRIDELARRHDRFLIAQGLFYNRQRHALRARHPSLQFVWVRTAPHLIEDRVRQRQHPLADVSYARLANPHFEIPDFPHLVIDNNGSPEEGIRRIGEAIGVV